MLLVATVAGLLIGALLGYLVAARRSAELAATLTAERAAMQDKLSLLDDARDQMGHHFRMLAAQALEERSDRLAAAQQERLGNLLNPLKSRLEEFQRSVNTAYVQESKDRSALAEQVRNLQELNQQLSSEARELTRALKGSSKQQGQWGELVLERILEAAGLRRDHEYTLQMNFTREDASRAQPDVVLHMPGGRTLVVDAKVSLTAYNEYCATEDAAARRRFATKHVGSLREHIRGLAQRNYQRLPGLETLDFVMIFVPIEPAFLLALETEPDLWLEAWQKNILLVSPSTLLFVVRTVAHLWRQEEQSRNVQQIAQRGAELYDKFVAFVEDLGVIGTQLERTRHTYDAAFEKLSRGRGNLVRQAEKLRELGIQPSKQLPRSLIDSATDDPAPASKERDVMDGTASLFDEAGSGSDSPPGA